MSHGQSPTEPTQSDSSSGGSADTPKSTGNTSNSPRSCGSIAGCLAGIIAALLVWLVMQQTHPIFGLSPETSKKADGMGITNPDVSKQVAIEKAQARLKNAVLFVGLFGAIFGAGIGVAHGIANRNGSSVAIGLVICGITGGIAGCLGSAAVALAFRHLLESTGLEPLTFTIIAQAVLLGGIGAGIGLGINLVAGRGLSNVNCVLFGFIGGTLAAIIYTMGASIFFPGVQTETVIPGGNRISDGITQLDGLRLLWLVLAGGIIGAIVPNALKSRAGKKQ